MAGWIIGEERRLQEIKKAAWNEGGQGGVAK